jgi:hypothetical protein
MTILKRFFWAIDHAESEKIIYFNLHSTEMSKICTNIIKSIRKHVIRIFGMVFYRENVYPYF